MMLGAKRAVLVPFRFQIISVVPELGGSCWVREYWHSRLGPGPTMLISSVGDLDPNVRLFIWCEFAEGVKPLPYLGLSLRTVLPLCLDGWG